MVWVLINCLYEHLRVRAVFVCVYFFCFCFVKQEGTDDGHDVVLDGTDGGGGGGRFPSWKLPLLAFTSCSFVWFVFFFVEYLVSVCRD